MNNIPDVLLNFFLHNKSVSTDSRNIIPNSIFFALKGENFNGNEFAYNAIEKGASLAVIDEKKYNVNDKFILVDDVLKTLQQLSLQYRKLFSIPIIGITGSNGKTTTKELVNAVLSSQFNCHATKGNLNNHIGVPLTLLSITNETDIAIVEMGANHIGEIEELCNLALPDYGIITNIGAAHLEGFKNIDNIVQTKTALFRAVNKSGNCLFVNSDDALLMKHSEKINKKTYSINGNADINATLVPSDTFLVLNWEGNLIQTNLFGDYNIHNVLAAITAGLYFSVKKENIIQAISQYMPQNNRSQLIKTGSNTVVMDAYNANPSSMKAAINSFHKMNAPEKMLIIGDMLELGADATKEHLNIIELVVSLNFKDVFLVGEIFNALKQNTYKAFQSTGHLNAYLCNNMPQNKTILLKASRGIKLEHVLDILKDEEI